MSEKVYPVPASWKKNAFVDDADYKKMYAESIKDPAKFWGKHAKRLDWFKAPKKIKNTTYAYPKVSIKWYEDGVLNVSYNCIDRHLAERGDRVAIVFEGDQPGEGRQLTYRELHEEVCRFANVLKANGARRGDRVTIYMPMIPEAAIAMLACSRIGAVPSVVSGGFPPTVLPAAFRIAIRACW